METVLRDACDNCHRKKNRCQSEGSGAFVDCRQTGQTCVYPPGRQMGRPWCKRPGQERAKASNLTSTTELRRKNQQPGGDRDVSAVVESIIALPPSPWSNSTNISPLNNSFIYAVRLQGVDGPLAQPAADGLQPALEFPYPPVAAAGEHKSSGPAQLLLSRPQQLQAAIGQSSPPLDPCLVPDNGEMNVYRQLSQLLFALHKAQ
ncbi:C6 transcription factor [Colletotrichum sojae]|uniref:C6 transcription factor n=1 Tax=Colletotrichum sojae TaxID=2175907 RepID=A0A8H6IQ88_9PEZI|nr:C6 transcription factor [Colletotrichum sojae]